MKKMTFYALWAIMVSILAFAPTAAQDAEQTPEPLCATIARPDVDLAFYVGQGDVYFAERHYTRALETYTCALERDPDFVPALVHRGYAYAIQGNDDQAMADYARALELDANSITAYNNRGVLYTNQGRFRLALADFELAITLAPDYAVAYHNRGMVHAIEGRYDMAIADFEQAIALNPDFAEPYAALGMVYSALSVANYARYREALGDESARLPAGDADVVLLALESSLETGNFSIWLPMLAPAQ